MKRVQQGGVNLHILRVGTGIGVGYKHIHMAAAKLALVDALAKRVLQKQQIFRQSKRNIQKTMVHGL